MRVYLHMYISNVNNVCILVELATAMEALGLAIILSFLFTINASPLPSSYDTIVIGIGPAGATAASTLAKAGKKVLVLEAQDRIGGRVKTIPFGDGLVEEGAEWIHGTENSRVYQAAISNNISVWEQDINMQPYNSDGRPANNSLINELMEFCMSISDNKPDKSEGEGAYITRSLINNLKEKHPDVLKDEYFVNEFLELQNIAISDDYATNDWNDLNTKSSYIVLDGGKHTTWHRNGYKTFFEILLNTYKNGPGWPTLDIKLNKEVTQIKWPQNSSGSVEVVCKDGDVYTANNVIVTVSLGVLKERYSDIFSPLLPEDKVTAINKMTFGVIGKIILSFPEKWWNNTGYMLYYLPGDKEKICDDTWMKKMRYATTPAGSSNTLTLWTSGDATKAVEALPEDVVKEKAMKVLRHFLGKDMTISEPTGIIRSMWFTNPFTRGTYSYDGLATQDYPNARATLGEPLFDVAGNPKVLFAGEATDVTHFATVHGASDSGYREAMRLLNVNK